MISLYELKNKLNYQAKEFAQLLELPSLYAQGLWSEGVYSCPSFTQTHEQLEAAFANKSLESILDHDSFRYLMINECDDQHIIESLHREVNEMASRIERLMLVDYGALEVISAIYRVLGLPDEANFIVNTGANFKLDWQPYFSQFEDPTAVQYADLRLHGCYYRLIASKFPFSKVTLDKIKKYLYITHLNYAGELEEDTRGEVSFADHENWLISTLELFIGGKLSNKGLSPTTFKIDGMRYLVHGFPLKPSLVSGVHKPELVLQVKNLDGNQKFIVRIEQQTLVFYARRIDKRFFNTISYAKYVSLFESSVLSHADAAKSLLDVGGVKYLSCFRPYSLEDIKEGGL